MASTAAPYGLRPVSHPSGAPIRIDEYTIASTYASSIYQGSPVKIHTDGTINIAAAGDRMVGCFIGCEYTSGGRRVISNYWPASTTATDIIARVTTDPDIVYEIQANAAIAVADIGTMADHTGTSGSTVTGQSTTALDTVSTSTEATYLVIGISRAATNAAGDAKTDVYVKIAEHQWRAAPDSSMAS